MMNRLTRENAGQRSILANSPEFFNRNVSKKYAIFCPKSTAKSNFATFPSYPKQQTTDGLSMPVFLILPAAIFVAARFSLPLFSVCMHTILAPHRPIPNPGTETKTCPSKPNPPPKARKMCAQTKNKSALFHFTAKLPISVLYFFFALSEASADRTRDFHYLLPLFCVSGSFLDP